MQYFVSTVLARVKNAVALYKTNVKIVTKNKGLSLIKTTNANYATKIVFHVQVQAKINAFSA